MPNPTVIATAKSTTANSYVTRAEAQSYYDGRLDVQKWTDASGADQDRAVIMATNRLEQDEYVGNITDLNQRLKWPRNGALDDEGNTWDQDVVPRTVKEATYETALALLKGELVLADTGLEGFQSVKVGPLDITPNNARRAGSLPKQAIRLLRGLRLGPSGQNFPVVRG